jgi:hypothetical protein
MAPTVPPPVKKRHFTPEEANRALPLVRRIVADVVSQWEVVHELENRLSTVTSRGPRKPLGDLYDEEVARSRAELEEQRGALQGYLDELRSIGVELKGTDGLVDFPSLREGREVYLCWRPGEPEVAYWHEATTGFAGRRPIREGATPAATGEAK